MSDQEHRRASDPRIDQILSQNKTIFERLDKLGTGQADAHATLRSVDKRLDRIDVALDKIDRRADSQSERITRNEAGVASVTRAVGGNGRPGLSDRVSGLEEWRSNQRKQTAVSSSAMGGGAAAVILILEWLWGKVKLGG